MFIALLYSAGAAFLFYRSVWGMLLAVIFVPMYLKKKKKEHLQVYQKRLLVQFQSGIQMVSGALNAGYSMENAWKYAQEEIKTLYGEKAEFYQELNQMNQKIRMNEPLEQILFDFADKTESEDIYNFAEIIRYVRRSGGNLTEIIRTTVSRIQEKEDTLGEIENVITAKKAEQKMMSILLPGILLFITLSSPDYTAALYHTGTGFLVMSICLIGYLAACWWSEKLMDISV